MTPDETQKPPPRITPTIEAVLADPDLTREQKIKRLVEMCRDARALEVASGEGMVGAPAASGLNRIHRALRELGAEDAIEPGSH